MSLITDFLLKLLEILFPKVFEGQKQTMEHDIKLFKKSDGILSEKKINNITFELIERHSISRENSSLLSEWSRFTGRDENKYINSAVNIKSQKLLFILRELIKFIFDNFDFWKNVDGPLYLKPELDPDKAINEDDITQKQVDKYHSYATELNLLTTNLKRNYSEYRITVKNKLKI